MSSDNYDSDDETENGSEPRELTADIAKVPRNADGERVAEKRTIEVAGQEYAVWIRPMALGDQMELNQEGLDLNDFTDEDTVFEMYDRFVGERTKDALTEGEEFTWEDVSAIRVGFATELIEEITAAAGFELGAEEREQLEETLQEAQAGN